jgi:hypothetical protein
MEKAKNKLLVLEYTASMREYSALAEERCSG